MEIAFFWGGETMFLKILFIERECAHTYTHTHKLEGGEDSLLGGEPNVGLPSQNSGIMTWAEGRLLTH